MAVHYIKPVVRDCAVVHVVSENNRIKALYAIYFNVSDRIKVTDDQPSDGFEEFFPVKIDGIGLSNCHDASNLQSLKFAVTILDDAANCIVVENEEVLELINNARFEFGLSGIDAHKWMTRDQFNPCITERPEWFDYNNDWHNLLVLANSIQTQYTVREI